jgi:hypothetical protein
LLHQRKPLYMCPNLLDIANTPYVLCLTPTISWELLDTSLDLFLASKKKTEGPGWDVNGKEKTSSISVEKNLQI